MNHPEFHKISFLLKKYLPTYIFHLAALPLAKIDNLNAEEAIEGSVLSTTQIIEACSILKEVTVDTPKSLFKKYRRLGVYKWEDVLKTADNDCENKLVALHFGKTELFKTPVPWQNMQKVLEDLPINKSIITATPVPGEVFMTIYRQGMNNNA